MSRHSPVMLAGSDPDDGWLTTIANLDRSSALAFLVETERASVDSLLALADASLLQVELDPTVAEQWLQLADDLRNHLLSPTDMPISVIPPAVDAQLDYALARLWVHRGQLTTAEDVLRRAQEHWRRANDLSGLARTQLGLTQILAMQGRYTEAEAAARQAIAAFTNDAVPPATGDLEPSDEHPSESSTAQPGQSPNFPFLLQQAGAYRNLATLLLYTERHAEALAEYDRALQLLSTIARATLTVDEQQAWLIEIAHNELNRAGALTFLDEPEQAEAALLRAAEYFTQAADSTNHGRAQTNLGRLYLRMGHYADALAAFDLAAGDLLGEQYSELLVTLPTAPIARQSTDADATSDEPFAPEGVELLRQADELLLEQAMAYLVMNLLPEARQRLAHCELLFRTAEQPYELGQTLYTLGLLQLRSMELAAANTRLSEAAVHFAQLDNQFWLNRTALAQAALLYADGDLTGAVARLDRLIGALPPQSVDDDTELLLWDVGGLVELYLLRMRLAIVVGQLTVVAQWAERIAELLSISWTALQAEAAAQSATETSSAESASVEASAENGAIVLPHLTQRFFHLLGQWARAQNLPLQARYYFHRAIGLLENTRALLPVEEIRTAFLDDKSELYADLILLLLDQADADPAAVADAFAAVERARSRALLERLLAVMGDEDSTAQEHVGSTDVAPDRSPQSTGAAEERSTTEAQATVLRNRLHWLYNQLLGESGSRRLDAQLSAQLLAEEATLRRIEWCQSTLLQQAEPADLSSFQAALRPDQQAIVFVILTASPNLTATPKLTASPKHSVISTLPSQSSAEEEVMAFLVDKVSITPYRHLTTTAQLVPTLEEFRFQLGRAELGPDYLQRHRDRLHLRLQQAAGKLYDQLLAPIRPAVTKERLLIVPYGPLHRLPFHALWDGNRYLLEQMSISYAPSASTVVMRRQVGGTVDGNYDAVHSHWAGMAVEDAAIPAARSEVTAAAGCFASAQLFLDEDAGHAGLARAAQADILHLATHGLFRPDNPFFSALKLADGWINVRELYRLPLRARLVVLSACESGAGVVHGGDEVVGLVRGFLGAGAREVLASLWNVHDATAVDFMRQFYLALTDGKGVQPSDALRSAQCWAIGKQLHPYYWAPFYVIGE